MRTLLRPLPRLAAAVLALALCLGPAACADAGDAGGFKGPLDSVDILRAVTEARGKVVVLNFWASWCQPCRMEIPELKKVRERFGADELYLLGVSVDHDARMYQSFVDKAGFNYPVGLGSAEALEMFQVGQVPRMMVYDRQGRLVLNREGVVTASRLTDLVRRLLDG